MAELLIMGEEFVPLLTGGITATSLIHHNWSFMFKRECISNSGGAICIGFVGLWNSNVCHFASHLSFEAFIKWLPRKLGKTFIPLQGLDQLCKYLGKIPIDMGICILPHLPKWETGSLCHAGFHPYKSLHACFISCQLIDSYQ